MSRPRRPAAAQGGYIYVSDEPRHGELIADEASFTAIVASQPRIAARQPAFLTLNREHVDAVARMSQAGPAASFKARVRFDETHQLIGEVSWSDVLDNLSPAARAEIEAVLARGGGELGESAFAELVDTLERLCPESGGDIDLVLMLSRERAALPRPPEGEPITMFEGDAVALALDMAGFDRRNELAYWTGDAQAPFLAGVSSFSLLEDRMIDNDAHVFGDWELIAANAVGWAEFEHDGDHLWTINVNRSSVERSLGVDLIYYTHAFNAYVLVQYKRMERENGRNAVFRPSDTFEDELARMRALVLGDAEPADPAEYRLDAHCCYLKLCPAVAKEIPVGSLGAACTYRSLTGTFLLVQHRCWDRGVGLR